MKSERYSYRILKGVDSIIKLLIRSIKERLPFNKVFFMQKILKVDVRYYVYNVLYVEDEEKYFLKTIYPSREATKKYLKREEPR